MTERLDRRLYAYRGDLADAGLRGRVEAARYVEGRPYHVIASIAPLHPEPSTNVDLDTEALGGENVRVFEMSEGWTWCQLVGDGYVGYMPAAMLVRGEAPVATHKVASREALAYSEPSARSKPVRSWLFGSAFRAKAEHDDFFEIAEGGFIGRQHVESVDAIEPDYVATAETLLGAPYLWGGKSVRGIDCSGLVQLSLQRAGIACPRDTDMQARELPADLEVTEGILGELQRGDLVYWPRHVGIMMDDARMIHANGTNMSTTIERVAQVAERSRQGGPHATAVKRLMAP